MIYILIFILLTILTIRFDFSGKFNKKIANFWYISSCLILIIVSGLRYKVGGDTLSYMYDFNDLPYIWELHKFNFSEAQYDPLWIIFSSLSKSIINDFTFFQILHASIINIILFRFIKQNTPYRFTAILLYALFFYLYFNMEIMRESLAVCTFLLAYPYYKSRKWLKYYLITLVGFLFHSSAIITFIFPLLRNIKFRSWAIVLLIGVFLAIISIPDAIKNLLGIFLFNDRLSSRFLLYSGIKLNSNGVFTYFVLYFLFPSILIGMPHLKTKNELFKELLFSYFFIVVVVTGFSGFNRFLNYLTPFMAVYFANSLNEIYRSAYFARAKRLAVFLLMVIAFIPKLNYYFLDTSNIVAGTRRYNGWFPYSSVFNKEENHKRERLYEGLTSAD
jgi:hypothetical protein